MKLSSINDGRIVAFEGETVQDNQPPDVWRFERSDEDLFRLKGFEEIEPCPVSKFYHTTDSHNNMCFAEARQGDEGLWVGSLIPIPMMWAPLFLDYPNMGTTYRRVEDLVQGVDHTQRRLFKPLLMSVAYACHQRAGSQGSALLMDWKRVARLQHTLPILMRLWSGGEEDDEGSKDDDQSKLKDPPEIIPQAGNFDSLFVGGRRSRPVSVPKPPQRRAYAPSPEEEQ
jgi:hypothetical protein